ncbi:ribonuclease H [Senna tora]|uniref:Ribonuclease H n=1 Tax=Senna tora TaxID=362788 RepID=A0A834X5T9_9FABA|nr:ribonuclease H [Senna tora]
MRSTLSDNSFAASISALQARTSNALVDKLSCPIKSDLHNSSLSSLPLFQELQAFKRVSTFFLLFLFSQTGSFTISASAFATLSSSSFSASQRTSVLALDATEIPSPSLPLSSSFTKVSFGTLSPFPERDIFPLSRTEMSKTDDTNGTYDKMPVKHYISKQRSQDVGRYLGANITSGRQRKGNFKHIIESIQKKLAGWKASCLSLAGRATLVQSALSTIPLYHMQHNKIPKGVVNQIEKIERDFLWGSTPEKRSLHQVSWDQICLPRSLGGLGINSLQHMNDAFIFKLAWKLLCNKKDLWINIVKSKYNVDSFHRSAMTCKVTDSRLWKEIVRMWPKFYDHVSWAIGNGESINFWEDKWVEGLVELKSYCQNTEGIMLRKEHLIDYIDEAGNWKRSELMNLLQEEVLDKLVEMKPPDPQMEADIPIWNPGKNGDFSVRSAYLSIRDLKIEEKLVWKAIWKAKTQQRNKMLLWRLGHEKLPTRSRIASWSNMSPICQRCGNSRESNIHMIRDCARSVSIWKAFINPKERALFFCMPMQEWISWNLLRTTKFSGIPWGMLFPIVCKLIWEWRNKFNKENDFVMPKDPHNVILQQAKIQVQCWRNEENMVRLTVPPMTIYWKKPKNNWVKLNIDGAVCRMNNSAGCGGLLRDSKGEWVGGFMAKLGPSSVLSAELWSFYYGLNMAWELGMQKIEVESDSKAALIQIKGEQAMAQPLHPIIPRIRSLLKRDWEIELKHIPRQINKCADILAKQSLSGPLSLIKLEVPPASVVIEMAKDAMRSMCKPRDPGG